MTLGLQFKTVMNPDLKEYTEEFVNVFDEKSLKLTNEMTWEISFFIK